MAPASTKQKLIGLIERRVWKPILRASPAGRSATDQKRLERVQRKTETQRDRYRGYESAGRVRLEFQRDLRSRAAKSTNADLQKLELPTQPAIADDFFALADRLGIEPAEPQRDRHEPHPPHPWHKKQPQARERAKRELVGRARKGDQRAVATLRQAPRSWARKLGRELSTGGTRKRKKPA